MVHGKNNTTGIGLVEAYDLDESIGITLTNVSTRSFVDTDQNVMIGGFISGDVIVRVIVRALGPTLSAFGAPNVLADPTLELRDLDGTLITSNDNWKDTQQAEIQASGKAPPNDNESAIIIVRPAANNTAIVRGKNNTGNALIDAYILPRTLAPQGAAVSKLPTETNLPSATAATRRGELGPLCPFADVL
jgi:hypothetical protein